MPIGSARESEQKETKKGDKRREFGRRSMRIDQHPNFRLSTMEKRNTDLWSAPPGIPSRKIGPGILSPRYPAQISSILA
jgi:hypothetical protein